MHASDGQGFATPGDPSRNWWGPAWRLVRVPALAAGGILLGVLVLQLREGAYQGDLASHPDEAAHFVTAVCLLDYVRTALGTSPVEFAESYYVRYPKVAFGHWPPAFFGVQALWYWIVGATPPAAILLVGLITAVAVVVLFFTVRRLFGTWIAIASCAVFAFLPLVQRSASLVMADMLASLLAFLAMLAFCRSLTVDSKRSRAAALFWAAMAMLTKESALLLFLVAPAAFMFLGKHVRQTLQRTISVWIGLCFVALLAVLASYQAAGVLHLRELPHFVTSPGAAERLQFLTLFLRNAPLTVFVIAAIGVVVSLMDTDIPERRPRIIYLRGALLWLVISWASQFFFRDMVEPRYYLPALFPLMILFAAGLDRVARWTIAAADGLVPGSRRPGAATAYVLLLAVSALCIATMPSFRLQHRSGYARLAQSLPASGPDSVLLVSSDSSGEGAIIVERLVRDDRRQGVVLRASKLLASSDWMGGNYRPRVITEEQVRDLLDSTPVRFIVIDMYGFISEEARTHHRLLDQTMRDDPRQFPQIADLPLVVDGRRREGAIQVYENLGARGRRPDVLHVEMEETLGRSLELHLNDGPFPGAASGGATARDEATGGRIRDIAIRLGALVPVGYRTPPPMYIGPTHDSLSERGGPGQIYVTADPDREWQAQPNESWVTITSGRRGMGDGVVRYDVEPNESGVVRQAEIVIGEMKYSIIQQSKAAASESFSQDSLLPPPRRKPVDNSSRTAPNG